MAFLISSCSGNSDVKVPSEEQICSSSGGSWLAGAGCCGDASNDCGIQSNGAICSIDSDLANSKWADSKTSIGEIITLGCSKTDYVSDGSRWIKCGDFSVISIAEHDYLCNDDGTIVQASKTS